MSNDVTHHLLDRYRFSIDNRSLIGSGGMGVVYRGTDIQTNVPVAIKELRKDIIDKDSTIIGRFKREGELLRLLNHPNIVKVFGTDEIDGTHYIIMEYVAAGSLRSLLKREGKLSVEQTLSIALELADALSRAHHKQVIHRDLKPDNVLIAEDGTPRLTDFGVAHLRNGTRMTQDGSIIGTIAYLAPECFSGQFGINTDIWAFGVMLFEMLSGTHPFEDDTVAQTITTILTTEAPTLSSLSPHVPQALVTLINHLLQKDPSTRPQSMRQIAANLEAIQAGQDIPLELVKEKADPQATNYFTDEMPTTPAGQYHLVPISKLHEQGRTVQKQIEESSTQSNQKRPLAIRNIVFLVLFVGAISLVLFALQMKNQEENLVTSATLVGCDVSETMHKVIVANLEAVETNRLNPTRFIVDKLRQSFEIDAPFSNIRICQYDPVIKSSEEAISLAREQNALAVIWGLYTEDAAEVTTQPGYPLQFKHISTEREDITAISTTQAHIVDPGTESLAPNVLGVLVSFQNADGDGYGVARTITLLDVINVQAASIVGESAAAYSAHYFFNFLDDPEYAIEMVSRSLDLSLNHLQYISRSGTYLRLGDKQSSRADALTAMRLAPDDYMMPPYILGNIALAENDYPTALSYFDQIVENRPEDWFIVNFRGGANYLLGNYDAAYSDVQRAIELGPDANFPYMLLLMLSIRKGDILQAQNAMRTALDLFPDPSFGSRIVASTFNDQFPIVFAPIFSAFGHLSLAQYDKVLTSVEEAIAIAPELSDLYLMRGFAYCNLGDYAASEAAYTQAIELDENFTALYVFRAEVRLRQGNFLNAGADASHVLRSPDSELWLPIMSAAQSGEITCENVLDVDLEAITNDE
jgi:serine/threonine protein kinase/tetratricopeptide (TPR) repeat protein